jgi:hypothetical protein
VGKREEVRELLGRCPWLAPWCWPVEGYGAMTRNAGHARRRRRRAEAMLVMRIPLSMTAFEATR